MSAHSSTLKTIKEQSSNELPFHYIDTHELHPYLDMFLSQLDIISHLVEYRLVKDD